MNMNDESIFLKIALTFNKEDGCVSNLVHLCIHMTTLNIELVEHAGHLTLCTKVDIK